MMTPTKLRETFLRSLLSPHSSHLAHSLSLVAVPALAGHRDSIIDW